MTTFHYGDTPMRRLVPVVLLLCAVGATSAEASTRIHSYVTAYGGPDNDPPNSSAIAFPKSNGYPTVHDHAGGVGTYDNPITVASSPKELRIGARIYLGYLNKYFVMEDRCAKCVHQWHTKHTYRVDIWVGGKGYTKHVVLARERHLTRHTKMVVHPPRGLPVNRTPLLK